MRGINKLHTARDAWSAFAGTLDTAANSINDVITTLTDINTPSANKHITNLKKLQTNIKNLEEKCRNISTTCDDYADQILITRGALVALNIIVTITLAATLGAGLTGPAEEEIAAIGGPAFLALEKEVSTETATLLTTETETAEIDSTSSNIADTENSALETVQKESTPETTDTEIPDNADTEAEYLSELDQQNQIPPYFGPEETQQEKMWALLNWGDWASGGVYF